MEEIDYESFSSFYDTFLNIYKHAKRRRELGNPIDSGISDNLGIDNVDIKKNESSSLNNPYRRFSLNNGFFQKTLYNQISKAQNEIAESSQMLIKRKNAQTRAAKKQIQLELEYEDTVLANYDRWGPLLEELAKLSSLIKHYKSMRGFAMTSSSSPIFYRPAHTNKKYDDLAEAQFKEKYQPKIELYEKKAKVIYGKLKLRGWTPPIEIPLSDTEEDSFNKNNVLEEGDQI